MWSNNHASYGLATRSTGVNGRQEDLLTFIVVKETREVGFESFVFLLLGAAGVDES